MTQETISREELLIQSAADIPLGNNDLSLAVNYDQRVKYREGDYFSGLPKPIDTFYDKVFYGKIDRFQNVIVPKRDSSLIKQTSDNSNIFCFNFVADQFFKLKRNLKIAGDSGGIDRNNTKFYNINPTSGWFNYEPTYKRVLKRVFDAYDEELRNLDKRDFNKIITVKDYADGLLDYLKKGAYKIPITLTEFVLSTATPYTVTGITIEIANDSYSDDLGKFLGYLIDNNFPYYSRAARKFGFYVDRNGPWRLFADVLSTPMLEEMANYDANKKNFFDMYYDRTYTLDLQLFQEQLVVAYNKFAEENYYITESSTPTVSCPTSRINVTAVRKEINLDEVVNFGNSYWLSFYFNLRSAESGVRYKNGPSLVREAIKASNVYGFDKGLIYVNNLFKPYLYDKRLFNKNFLTRPTGTVTLGSVLDGPTTVMGPGSYSY